MFAYLLILFIPMFAYLLILSIIMFVYVLIIFFRVVRILVRLYKIAEVVSNFFVQIRKYNFLHSLNAN